MIRLKRIYEPASENDGVRILVDRLWPRGITKEKAQITLWLKDVSPSPELRTWFSHEPEKWEEFRRLYLAELSKKRESLEKIKKIQKENSMVTLVFGAKDEEHTHALVIAEKLNALNY